MPAAQQDIFDQVAPSSTQGGGDVFDQVASPAPAAPQNPYANQTAPAAAPPQAPPQAQNLPTVSAAPEPGMLERFHDWARNSAPAQALNEVAPGVAQAIHMEPTESETARMQRESDTSALEYHPVESAKQVASGIENLGESGLFSGMTPGGGVLPTPEALKTSGPRKVNADQAALGGTQIMGGTMGATKPLMALGIATAPFRAAAFYGAGILSGNAASDVAAQMGATPNEQEFFKTAAFFIPDAAVKAAGIQSFSGEMTVPMRDADGTVREVPFKTAAAGRKGFGFAAAKGEDGSYYAAGRVGPFSARVRWGGTPETEAPGAPAAPRISAPAPPPDPVTTLASEQASAVTDAAARAADTEKKAADLAAGVPPPKPPTIPAPAGMDDGALTQDTVSRVAEAIRMLPPEQQAPAVLEATGHLANWLHDKRTVVGPDGKVISVDSPKAAQTAAVKIINDEVERQMQAEAAEAQQRQQAEEQQRQEAETARQEQEQSLEPKKPAQAEAAKTEIPNTPQVQRARSLLQSLPEDATAAKMDQHLRNNVLLPTPVRKGLVDEEVSRRAQLKETAAQEAMTGKATPEGQHPEEIEKWIQGVKDGDEPFAHIQKSTTYKPKNTEGLSRTKVEGAKDASGVYYHDPGISGAEIRKAAREGTLDKLREEWKKGEAEFGGTPEVHAAETKAAKSETEPENAETAGGEPETAPQEPLAPYEGVEGKHVQLHLADESSIPAVHRVVGRSALTASHNGNTFHPNERYPQYIQERRYESNKGEQMKVIGQASDFKPELIVNTDPTATSGAPIVTSKPVTIDGITYPAGLVLGGNSRKMTLDRLYTNGAAAPYIEELQGNHRAFGFSPEFLENFHEPVHVREIEPPKTLEEMHRLGSLLNKGLTQSLDTFDQAVSLGKQLSTDTLEGIANAIRQASDGDSTATLNSVLTDKTSGRQIVKMLERDGIITDRNRGNFVDPSTLLLTAPARTQLGNALLANLLDSRELMEKTPAFLKQRLLGSIGSISAITARDDGWNLAPALREAAKQFGELHRQSGMSPTEALRQQGMFGEERGPVVEALIKAYDKSVAEIRKSLSLFSIGADEGRNPSGRLVGIAEQPDPYLDFNFAFGTELTKEQFDAEMEKLRSKAEAPTDGITQTAPGEGQAETTPEPGHETAPAERQIEAKQQENEQAAPGHPKPIAKGDKVTYTTNAGKQRAGEIAFTDGRIARIKDAKTGSVITKKIADVQRVEEPKAAAEPETKTEEPTEQAGAPRPEESETDSHPADEPNTSVEPATEKPETLIRHIKGEIADGNGPTNYNELKALVRDFDGAEPDQLRMKQAQEAYEAALVDHVSGIAELASVLHIPQKAFDELVKIYENQPNLFIRTSTSITNQAYSTPAPLAFIVGKFAGLKPKMASVYEPTAGNGMLLMAGGVSPATRAEMHVNELNGDRAANLFELGFQPTTNDATKWTPDVKVDAVVANPPFGNLPGPVDFDGYTITKLEHLIALKALSAMKDNGRAAIIIGASKEPGEVTAPAKPFFNYLYSHYNVVADFELAGEMYSRQGAAWPVRVIAVDGRARSAKVCPPASEIERLTTWEGVYDQARQHLGADLEGQRQPNDVTGGAGERGGSAGSGDVQVSSAPEPAITHQGESEASPEGSGDGIGSGQPGPIEHTGGVPAPGVGSPDNVVASDGDVASSDRLAEDQPREKAVRRGTPKPSGHSSDALAPEGNQFQDPYSPFSEKKDVNVLAPKAMMGAMQRAMEMVAERVGDIDQFVADELGYTDVETMQDAFMGLQVDTIAAAIHAIQRGKGIIIADQTGIGKGRQAAAVIRWAELHGHLPIFVTAKPALFTDMYGDLHDIGSGHVINPLLMNADATITHPITGVKVFGNDGRGMTPVFQRILETGKLPEGRNALFTTYSQVNTPNRQQLVLQRLAPKAVFILDEAHKAGGESNTGLFFRSTIGAAKGAVFLSATYAKRPDNLPLYADKTDIGLAITDRDRIVSAIQAGGAPLQAVVSNQLAQAGQLFRRERSFDGIHFNRHILTERKAEHEKTSDAVTEVLRAIVLADQLYHQIDFEKIQKEAEKEGRTARAGGNKASQTVSHMEFSSIVHNLTKQLLLGLKANDVADMIIGDIRDGKKPIVALENTMGSFLSHYVESNGLLQGAPLHNFSYSTVLQRALDRTRYYNVTDDKGKKARVEVPLSDLSDPVREAYERAQDLIRSLHVDIPVSPIDWIRHRVEDAGFKIAEITGRDLRVDYSRETPVLSRVPSVEKKDRVATAIGFNNGGIDALIMNQAGSTGISLHPSTKFKDQRPRRMHMVQPAGDVNEFMQMLGRINRTGQVRLPEYNMPAVDLPAEARPAMVLSKKMKSLNANTTSNTRSAVDVESPDMMNKYGDKVVQQYLAENHNMAAALGLGGDHGGDDEDEATEDLARKATGRSALLPVKEQREFLDAITEQYRDLIEYLDKTGQNDLEPKTYDFDAKERHKELIYRGNDPSSPFGQDAHFGEYSIKRQGKPYTPEEVKQLIHEGLNGAANDVEHHRALVAELDKQFKPFLERQTTGGSIERAQQTRQGTINFMSTYRVGAGVRLEINGEDFAGVITGIEGAKKPAGNPFAASAMKYTVAVNGPMRSIKVSGSELSKIAVMPLGSRINTDALFQNFNPDSRQVAKIITGNLLGAYGALKNVRGRIISFTMDDGSTHQGILMPAKFNPQEHVSQEYAMRFPEGALKFLDENTGAHQNGVVLQAPSGDVQILRKPGDTNLSIRTKTSKAVGGKYFQDAQLRGLVQDGEFVLQGGMMNGRVLLGKELEALRAIMQKTALYPTQSLAEQARAADDAVKGDNSPSVPSVQTAKATSPQPTSTQPMQLDEKERAMLAKIPGNVWVNSEGLLYDMGENDAEFRQYSDAIARLVRKGLVERRDNPEWGTDFRRTKEGTWQLGNKSSGAGSVTMSFLGTGHADEAMKSAAEYASKAVPATWNELVKAVGASGKSAKKIGYEFAAAFMPTSLADSDSLDIMGHATGEPALRIFEASQLLTGVKKMFEGMPQDKWVHYTHLYQTGQKLPSTDLQHAFDLMAEILHQQHEREEEAVNLGRDEDHQVKLTWKENYFPNRYSKGPGNELVPTEEEQIARIGGVSRRPFEGSKAFMKKQSYTLKQAVEKGAVPIGTPVDMLMRRLQEGSKFVAAHYAMHNFKEQGLLTFLRNGKKMLEGYADIDDRIAKVWRPVETDKGETVFVQAGKWIIQRDAGRLLNNYLSRDYIRGTEIGSAIVKLKNVTTEMRLALSPFHFGYITVENVASGLSVGLDRFYNQGVRGMNPSKIAEGMAEIGRSIIAPYTAVKVGGSMLKYAQNPDQFLASPEGQRFARLYPDYPRLMTLLFHGGLRWGMADTYKQSFGDGFLEAMKAGELGKGILKCAPWVAHQLMKPLFEHYIPRSKWAFAVQLLASKLDQYSHAIAAGTITEETIAREVAATTDNRFGELNWDSLFLHNTLRTGSQICFRSATWKLGAWRGLASAARETFTSKAFDDRIFDTIDEQATRFQWLKDASRRLLPQLGMNANWLLGMGITVAVMGGILSKMASGKWPWEWAHEDHKKDGLPVWGAAALESMHPRSGQVDSHGQPIRISFPTGLKDYEHGFTEPGRYVKSSLWDVSSNAWDTLENRDIFGNYVYNPNDPATKQLMQGFAYNLRGDFQPMSVSNYARQYGPQDAGSKLARATGMVGGAPRFLDETPALRRALSEVHHEPHTPEQEEAYQLAKHQPPTRAQVLRAARERNFTYLEKVVLHELTYQQAKDIYDNYANPEEKQQLKPVMERKRTLEILRARRR